MRLAVFASGSGSNFEAIARAAEVGEIPAELALLVSDQPDCLALKRAGNRGIPILALSPNDFESKAEFEAEIVKALDAASIDLVALAGYMRIVGPTLLSAYQGRIVNLHPALLPAFPGAHAITDALEAGVGETGVTVHYIDAGVDTGPVIEQRTVAVLPGDTEETLAERIHVVEHELYPKVLRDLLLDLDGRNDMAVRVGVIMGSISDWETMKTACEMLDQMGVEHEKKVVSAHRTPDAMFRYAESARERGLKVIIAGAGGAAHLPGMVAAKTTLPVIGVPVQTRALNGLDSLLSIVQMPAGIPVATTAIGRGGAVNAGLLAAQIVGAFDPEVAALLDEYRTDLATQVEESNEQLG